MADIDNEVESQDTDQIEEDVEVDLEEERLFNMSDEDLEKEVFKQKVEARQAQKTNVKEEEPDEDEVGSEEPEDDVEEDEGDVEEDEPEAEETEEVKPKAKEPSQEIEKFKVKANGVEFEFTKEELIMLAPKAMDYTKKMQQIAPFRKAISAMEENGLTENDINMLIEMKKGNKDAIAALIKEAKVDPLDIDVETEKQFVPQQYGMSETQLRIKEVVNEIQSDPEYKITQDVVDRQWDSASRKTLAENPDMIRGLHVDIKSGIYALVAPEMMKLKMLDGSRKSDLDYYLEAGNRIAERLKQENEVVKKEDKRQAQQKEIKEAAKKRESATLPRTTSGKKKVTDYLDEEQFEESYQEWYKRVHKNI